MAESAVVYVVQSLSDQINQKAEFLGAVRGQVEWLRNELQRMQCFLKDADAKQEGDERVKNWVNEIRNAAYDAEDIVDTFIFKIESWRRRGFIMRYAHISKELFDRNKVGKEIEALKARISDIRGSRETYGIKNIGEGTSSTSRERLRELRRSSPRGVDKDIIGMEMDVNQLVARLLTKENRLTVVSLVGMGGIGKTTLAKKVFNHGDVRGHFDCVAWIYLSQEYKLKDVLLRIIRQVTQPTNDLQDKTDNLQEEELEQMLYEHLQGKLYLVVVDDIWSKEAWDLLKRAFPDMDHGSKVMLTTRKMDVALHADPRTAPYELSLLGMGESWELFLRNTFHDGNCPQEFEDTGRRIVEKCEGLPLAINAVGGLLRRKSSVHEWERVLRNINSYFAKEESSVLAILAMSYIELPDYLKSCFLHLGLFPEDFVISTRNLFHLWIAEGLIPQDGERMEVIAEDYLNELIDRNLIQVVKTSASKRVKRCRLHDILRDLSIFQARKEIFLEVYGQKNLRPSENCRHLAVYSNFDKCFACIPPAVPKLRSLHVSFPSQSLDDSPNLDFNCFKLLRTLKLDNMRMISLPRKIGNLINLRYLSLRYSEIEELPSSMRKLQNLQTLDIFGYKLLKGISKVISKMENLRHLYMGDVKGNPAKKLRFDTQKNLQTLEYIRVDSWKLESLQKLLSLRKLAVYLSYNSDMNRFCNSVAKLEQLESMRIETAIYTDHPRRQLKGLPQLHRLTKLSLHGSIEMPSVPQVFPPNISHLTFCDNRISENPMCVLKQLPNLSILRLGMDSYSGNQLSISAGGFPLLKFLELKGLFNLEVLTIEAGAMPRLRHFSISYCKHLQELPVGIMSAKTLQELEICSMPTEFVNRLRGEDSYKVEHIPSITFN